MDPYLQRATSIVTAKKVVAGFSRPVSFIWTEFEGPLDGKTDLVVPGKVHCKLYILHSRGVHDVGWKGSELTISKRWCRTSGRNRTWVIERPLPKKYHRVFFAAYEC
jgi:hypothetical protein